MAFVGPFTWWHGLILLSLLGYVLIDAARAAQAHRAAANGAAALPIDEDALEEADPDMPWWRIALYLGLGLIGLPLGADLLVDSSVAIATEYGVSETVIGLTLVAIGTSLPELATTVMAAIRNHADVAMGNVIGSNMFNLLAIIGISSLIGPIPVDATILSFDIWVMLAASLRAGPVRLSAVVAGPLALASCSSRSTSVISRCCWHRGTGHDRIGDGRGETAGPGDGAAPCGTRP